MMVALPYMWLLPVEARRACMFLCFPASDSPFPSMVLRPRPVPSAVLLGPVLTPHPGWLPTRLPEPHPARCSSQNHLFWQMPPAPQRTAAWSLSTVKAR